MSALAATSLFNAADESTPGHYPPSQTAFLLLDFHSMFVGMANGPTAIRLVEVAAKMRTWAKEQGIQVIHCLMDTDSTPFPTCKDASMFASIVTALKSNGGEEPAELLQGGGDDITFTRRAGYVSALRSPGLEEFLKKKGIKSLVLAGLSTSGCVLRTAVTASDAEYVVSVISDACADQSQDVHDMMVGAVIKSRAYVTTGAEFQEGFTKCHAGK
ncbi:Isochorismatase hydrolase [Melanomma pulvis-pyrius CBS 109.77]|uniref:Isochorismatase hydrolase n=1 Tax=Melanomma pulvis-pyrius CBS 109.77 TaxID=1314802 RepID=A0A6A6XAA8_9PLEO|nr:Isochorismatase hydrolase [Melanomma pulvis-pyrius CBS 109.77]